MGWGMYATVRALVCAAAGRAPVAPTPASPAPSVARNVLRVVSGLIAASLVRVKWARDRPPGSHDPLVAQPADGVLGVAALAQDLVAVLAGHGRGPAHGGAAARQL